jgi:hypothetical protein
MPHEPSGRRPGLAWALLGLTVPLAAASVVIGSVRGEQRRRARPHLGVDRQPRPGPS